MISIGFHQGAICPFPSYTYMMSRYIQSSVSIEVIIIIHQAGMTSDRQCDLPATKVN